VADLRVRGELTIWWIGGGRYVDKGWFLVDFRRGGGGGSVGVNMLW
jgi:hypothetical protein